MVQTYFLPITFQATYTLIAFVVVFAIGILITLILMRYINRLKVMEVLRYE